MNRPTGTRPTAGPGGTGAQPSAREPAPGAVPAGPMDPPRAALLTGDRVRLEPLGRQHVDGLVGAVTDGQLWRSPYTTHIPAPDGMGAAVEGLVARAEAGERIPWAVVDTAGADDGAREPRVVGLTTFMNIDLAHRRVEIGNTYMAASTHGTGINAEVKLLLLAEAFEHLGCLRVELRTHHQNTVSRRAIERLGATRDGILRAHRIMPDGSLRDTVVYSILAREWPAARARLEHRSRPRHGA